LLIDRLVEENAKLGRAIYEPVRRLVRPEDPWIFKLTSFVRKLMGLLFAQFTKDDGSSRCLDSALTGLTKSPRQNVI